MLSHHTAERPVKIVLNDVALLGDLFLPDAPTGLVLFVHGSGSGRHSPRNRKVSEALTDAGVAALLFDLLTPSESVEDRWRGHLSFDIPFLTARLMGVLDWAVRSPVTENLGIGLFGASTGAAAALRTAAERPLEVQAVVSRGGRPDLAGDCLSRVIAPTLLIVGEKDASVLEMNRLSAPQLAGVKALHVVPGATHLFPESGALEDVGRAAADWFARYLQRNRPPPVSSSR